MTKLRSIRLSDDLAYRIAFARRALDHHRSSVDAQDAVTVPRLELADELLAAVAAQEQIARSRAARLARIPRPTPAAVVAVARSSRRRA